MTRNKWVVLTPGLINEDAAEGTAGFVAQPMVSGSWCIAPMFRGGDPGVVPIEDLVEYVRAGCPILTPDEIQALAEAAGAGAINRELVRMAKEALDYIEFVGDGHTYLAEDLRAAIAKAESANA